MAVGKPHHKPNTRANLFSKSVYNIKRRMASLPPITSEVYHAQLDPRQGTASESDSNISDDYDDEDISEPEMEKTDFTPMHCLFCTTVSQTLEVSVDHMSSNHGLFIPEPERLLDLETMINYLGLLVSRYNECIYCGLSRRSVEGIQQHMRDKGHCKIAFHSDSEIIDFWDFDDDENGEQEEGPAKPRRFSDGEMQLPSGVTVRSRLEAPRSRRNPATQRAAERYARLKAIMEKKDDAAGEGTGETLAEAPPSTDRRVALRGEMGLVGVPEQQRRALRAVEKKMVKQEATARAEQRWATEKVANKQKHFRVSGYRVSRSISLIVAG